MAAVELSDEELDIRQKLKDDFPHYASRCLKIRPKSGNLISFELNFVDTPSAIVKVVPSSNMSLPEAGSTSAPYRRSHLGSESPECGQAEIALYGASRGPGTALQTEKGFRQGPAVFESTEQKVQLACS